MKKAASVQMNDFDPYHKWLGIPAAEQPPNHYRLLGIALFEIDPDVIEAAADRQMVYVQQMANGPHVALSQKLLNELAAARVCLLKPDKKGAYDDALREAAKPQTESSTHFDTSQAVARFAMDDEAIGQAEILTTESAARPSRDVDGSLESHSRKSLVKLQREIAPEGRQRIAAIVVGITGLCLAAGWLLSKSLPTTPSAVDSQSALVDNGPLPPQNSPLLTSKLAPPVTTAPRVSSPAPVADFSTTADKDRTASPATEDQPAGTGSATDEAIAGTVEVAKIPATRPPVTPPALLVAPPPFDFANRARTATEAQASQEAWAKHLGREVVETNSIGMQLVLLPPGNFKMGSPASDNEASDEEKPQVTVTLTQPLFVGQTEVTQGQWQTVMRTTPWKGQRYVKEGAECAASYVSWDNATEFCRKLSANEGKTYRLLTEAEWEYACRAGTHTKYHFGDEGNLLGDYAWFIQNAWDIGEQYAQAVALKPANPFGLHDLHGNVWEWCGDWFGGKLPGGANPLVSAVGPGRVARGASSGDSAGACRSANRSRFVPRTQGHFLGFRVAQVVLEASTTTTNSRPQPTGSASTTVAAAPAGDTVPQARTEAEAKAAQNAAANQLGVEVVQTNSIGIDMVLIPAREFLMGLPISDSRAQEIEQPQQSVQLIKPFWIGRTEVTRAQWKRIIRTDPWKGVRDSREGADYPAMNVSRLEAEEFCRKLSEKEGVTYRLPSEAEWEYACRAGTTTNYCFGDDASQLGDYAWFEENTADVGEKYAHQVGQKKPNAWGLHDMHGNVWEWCQDEYQEQKLGLFGSYIISRGVLRGGSWYVSAGSTRTADRYRSEPGSRGVDGGFRLARTP